MFLVLSCLLIFSVPVVMAKVAIFCYHEIDRPNDSFAISSGRFESHLKYLQKAGYHFVTLDEYLAYTDGKLNLPEKSVMITFDDGYQSFYTKVYPLLKKYDVPAMLAIVTSWTDGEGLPTDVRAVATWDELREMEKNGLVTIVSHSHALHKQQALDPQGDRNGIAGAHLYLNGRYETDEEYKSGKYRPEEQVIHVEHDNLVQELSNIKQSYSEGGKIIYTRIVKSKKRDRATSLMYGLSVVWEYEKQGKADMYKKEVDPLTYLKKYIY